jgi:hypothetical protein
MKSPAFLLIAMTMLSLSSSVFAAGPDPVANQLELKVDQAEINSASALSADQTFRETMALTCQRDEFKAGAYRIENEMLTPGTWAVVHALNYALPLFEPNKSSLSDVLRDEKNEAADRAAVINQSCTDAQKTALVYDNQLYNAKVLEDEAVRAQEAYLTSHAGSL